MGRPYESEMNHLLNTFKWASSVNIDNLQKFIENTQNLKLLAIGSGGSLTTANFLAYIHQKYTGQLSCPSTTMRAMELSQSSDIVTWFLSASGKNSDIKMSFNHMLNQEVRQLAVFCCKNNSPLAGIACDHPYTNIFEYEPPCGKDGFLATNSLFGSILIITRAYSVAFKGERYLKEIFKHINDLLLNYEWWKMLEKTTHLILNKPVTLMLYDTPTMIGAFDLESKFTEAALGTVQLADYRNFAHGRHHWLAKKADQSGIMAFYSHESKSVAEKTLALIPSSLARNSIFFDMPPIAAAIASVVVAFRLTFWAGVNQSIDPGRPGVPEFGKRLYHLTLPRPKRKNSRMGGVQKIAIERKSGLTLEELEKSGMHKFWIEKYKEFLKKIKNSKISCIVLDYDGTVIDSRYRFSPPSNLIIKEFTRLLSDSNIIIGFSTGRGDSIRNDLRTALDENYWKRVVIGYYNGAEIGTLDDDHIPKPFDTKNVLPELLNIKEKIKKYINIFCIESEMRLGNYQIGLSCKNSRDIQLLWRLCTEYTLQNRLPLKIFYSGHSVDIISPKTSKLSIIDELQKKVSKNSILTIGDQGAWPGNDFELLSHPLALSVEKVNTDPNTCWNLAHRGQIGVGATQVYLSLLRHCDGRVLFDTESLK